MQDILWLEDIESGDTSKVGWKAFNLAETSRELDIPILNGFTTTSDFYRAFMTDTGLKQKISGLLEGMDPEDPEELHRRGDAIRSHIQETDVPEKLREELVERYAELGDEIEDERPEVAVRGSIIEEENNQTDQKSTFLNVSGQDDLIRDLKRCFSSFWTNKAIYRRKIQGRIFDLEIGVIVQRMGGSDKGSSGEVLSFDPESGSEKIVTVSSNYGFGGLSQGEVQPDEFTVFKESFGILEKSIGVKKVKMSRDKSGNNIKKKVPKERREKFSVTDNQVKELAKYCARIEEHYERPVELEWTLDNENRQIRILNVRKETVERYRDSQVIRNYRLNRKSEKILEGEPVGSAIESGRTNLIRSPKEIDRFEEGEVLVTDATGPEWDHLIEKAGALITNTGGRTSHAALKARKAGIPAIIGSENATSRLSEGDEVTVDCTSGGTVWNGRIDYNVKRYRSDKLPQPETDVFAGIERSDDAFRASQLPVDGAFVADLGTIVFSRLDSHPLKLVENGKKEKVVKVLKEEIGKIGAAFYPERTVIKLIDLGSDSYRALEDGEDFEVEEDNPKLGFRGSSRYYDDTFSKLLEMECMAIDECINELGVDNIGIGVPFCRTVEEAKNVKAQMKEYSIGKNVDSLLMVETPSNVVRADEFADIFDSFSIGLESLKQLTLGADSENMKTCSLADRRDPAVKKSVKQVIQSAHSDGINVNIFGGEDYLEGHYPEFLVGEGVDSITVRPENVLEALEKLSRAEEKESEERSYEFDVEGMVGTPARYVHESLETHGKATVSRLDSYTPDRIDSDTLHQALGWLANEGEITVESKKGEIIYRPKN